MSLLARLRARLVSRRTDWDADAFPLTPNDAIPPDQGDALSRPTEKQQLDAFEQQRPHIWEGGPQ